MFNLLFDILIYSFTPYMSYFFLLNINSKSYIYNLSVALIVDFLILQTYFYNTIFITLFFILRRKIIKLNYHNFNIYFLGSMFIILAYYLVSFLIFGCIGWQVLNVIIVNGIFILISYKKDALNIK